MSLLETIKKSLKEKKNNNIEILDRRQTQEELRNLIFHAKETILLISPYIDLSDELLGLLRACKAKEKVIIYRRGQYQIDWQELNKYGYRLCEVTNLHAKIYLSDYGLILSSLNLTISSNNNFEVSTLFRDINNLKNDDVKAIQQILKYAKQKN